MTKLFLLVFVGGGVGSVARFGAMRLITQFIPYTLPFASFGVNIIGSLLIGFLWAIPSVSDKNAAVHLLITGFCGGFTTFSAFSWENFNLLKQGDVFSFFIYAVFSVAVCILATWGGYMLGKS